MPSHKEDLMTQEAHGNSIYQFRAFPSLLNNLENDPDVMVHQQLARLRFFEEQMTGDLNSVLEFGCGFGFNCNYLQQLPGVAKVAGLDLSEGVINLARQRYPRVDFLVADACDPLLKIPPGEWNYVVACEVLEHVPDMEAFVENIRRHLRNDGSGFISTPNRVNFSLGHEPSPMNREHIKDLDFEEFRSLLCSHFSHVKIFGQRFRRKDLLEAWKLEVAAKIFRLEAGTRWNQPQPLRSRLRKIKAIDYVYRIRLLQAAWRFLRWRLAGRVATQRAIKNRPYSFADFEFVADDFADSLWFCAFVRA